MGESAGRLDPSGAVRAPTYDTSWTLGRWCLLLREGAQPVVGANAERNVIFFAIPARSTSEIAIPSGRTGRERVWSGEGYGCVQERAKSRTDAPFHSELAFWPRVAGDSVAPGNRGSASTNAELPDDFPPLLVMTVGTRL